jgi:hypothetical protein
MIGIGFSTKKKNLVSRLIRWGTHAEFSHTWPFYDHELYGTTVIVDADIRCIAEVEADVYLKQIDDPVMLVPPDGIDLRKGMPALGQELDRPYGVLNLIGHALVVLLSKLGKRIRNPFMNQKKPACIETSYCLLQAAGVLTDVDPETESPQSLHDRLLAAGWKRYYPGV